MSAPSSEAERPTFNRQGGGSNPSERAKMKRERERLLVQADGAERELERLQAERMRLLGKLADYDYKIMCASATMRASEDEAAKLARELGAQPSE